MNSIGLERASGGRRAPGGVGDHPRKAGCAGFRQKITMAFQPIVDVDGTRVFGHEALVRGAEGQSAGEVLGGVEATMLYAFDQRCRICAIESAAAAAVSGFISINLLPNALYRPGACLDATIRAAEGAGLPLDRLMFELSESEEVQNVEHVRNIVTAHRRMGLRTAIDDFGSGFAGLALLAEVQPDYLKIDRQLVRGIEFDSARESIVAGIRETARNIGVGVIAEGVETAAERDRLLEHGISLQQGFLFARPRLRAGVAAQELTGLPGRG